MKDFYEPDINHGSKDMHVDVATENNDIDGKMLYISFSYLVSSLWVAQI